MDGIFGPKPALPNSLPTRYLTYKKRDIGGGKTAIERTNPFDVVAGYLMIS
jgi:hypothetical protein